MSLMFYILFQSVFTESTESVKSATNRGKVELIRTDL